MEKITGIKIDSLKRMVSLIVFEPTLENYYEIIGCSTIEHGGSFPNGDKLYIDEEGYLKKANYGFRLLRLSRPICFTGNGVITNSSPDGDDLSAKTLVDTIIDHIEFWSVDEK